MSLYKGRGIARGINNTTDTLLSLSLANKKLEKEKEAFKLNKKLKNAQIDKAEFELNNLQENAKKRKNILMDIGRMGSAYKKGAKDGVGTMLDQYDWTYDLGAGLKISSKDKDENQLTPNQQRDSQIEKQRALSALNRGWILSKDKKGNRVQASMPNRDIAEAYIMEQFDVDLNDPDISSALDKYSTSPLAEPNPAFKSSRGLPALFSGNRAKITPRTQSVINNIQTQEDLDELLREAEDYKKEGVDVDAIKEYFGV
jgi:hypothetical protein